MIAQYRTTPNTELELRFRFERESFEKLFRTLAGIPKVKAELENSINVISRNIYERKDDRAQYIRKISFDKGVRQPDQYYRKERLATSKVAGVIDYTLSLSTETPIESFATRPDALIRVKARVSFSDGVDDETSIPAGWRVDMSATKTGIYKELEKDLKNIRDRMFPADLSVSNFFGSNLDLVTHYEVEIEHIGPDRDLALGAPADVANWLYSIVDPQWLQQAAYRDEIYRLAKVISPDPSQYRPPSILGLKRLSNQVKSFNKNTYYKEIFPPAGYYLTEKTDGQRCIASVSSGVCKMVSSSGMTVHELAKSGGKDTADIVSKAALEVAEEAAEWAIVGADSREILGTRISEEADDWIVVDGELVDVGGAKTYLIFDAIVFEGRSLTSLPFVDRHKFLEPAAKIISKYMPAKAKHFEVLAADTLEKQIRAVYESKYPYEIDGLIMTEPLSGYLATVNYKWKPLEHNTIDFLAVRAPANMIDRHPYKLPPGVKGTVYLLFSGIRTHLREQLGIGFVQNYRQLFGVHGHRGEIPPAYIPIQFSPSANPHAYIYVHPGDDIDRKVIELRRNTANTAWIFVRVRSDRSLEKNDFGNDFVIAEQTYMNYIDPFELVDLWRPSLGYFTKTAAAPHTAPNRYKRFIIGGLLQRLNLAPGAYVIDEAAGRGADLSRYQSIRAKNALFVDIDTTAIAELIVRKFDYFKRRQRRPRRGGADEDKLDFSSPPPFESAPATSMVVHTLVWDLKKTAELTAAVSRFGARTAGVDLIVCNFAFHYMCDTLANMRQLLKWNSLMLRPGGYFMFTVMDGQSVFELLAGLKRGESWSAGDDVGPKYRITKKYNGTTLSPAGQTIGVLMSFADEPIDEPLCNIDTVVAEAAKFGFTVHRRASFGAHFEEFAVENATMYSALSDIDKDYISLYHYVILKLG